MKKNNNLQNFIYYSSFVFIFTILSTSFLIIKNNCRKTRSEIIDLNKANIKQTSIVKELQSKKEYYLSEKHIYSMIKNKMEIVNPEATIIYLGKNE